MALHCERAYGRPVSVLLRGTARRKAGYCCGCSGGSAAGPAERSGPLEGRCWLRLWSRRHHLPGGAALPVGRAAAAAEAAVVVALAASVAAVRERGGLGKVRKTQKP